MPAIVLSANNGIKEAVMDAIRQIKAAQLDLLKEGIVVEPKYDVSFSMDVVVSANEVKRLVERATPEVSEVIDAAVTEKTTRTGTNNSETNGTSLQTSRGTQSSTQDATDANQSTRTGADSAKSNSTATDSGTSTQTQESTSTRDQANESVGDQKMIHGTSTETKTEYTD